MCEDRRGGRGAREIYQTGEVWVSTRRNGVTWRCGHVLRPVCNSVTVQSTAMRRVFVSALVLSALSVPASHGTAWAGPLQLTLDQAPPPDQDGAAMQQPAPQPQQRVAH